MEEERESQVKVRWGDKVHTDIPFGVLSLSHTARVQHRHREHEFMSWKSATHSLVMAGIAKVVPIGTTVSLWFSHGIHKASELSPPETLPPWS